MLTLSNAMLEIDFFGKSRPRTSAERERKIANFQLDAKRHSDFIEYGYEYFDGTEYGVGYGGYVYDARYEAAVKKIITHYKLNLGSPVLEIGCAKGFILHEFYRRGMRVAGIDLSSYAVDHAMPDVRSSIINGSCEFLPWTDNSFDFVFSKETLPHLSEAQLVNAMSEIMRVCSTNNIFLEIQVSEHERGRDLIKAWDETHKTVKNSAWWRSFLNKMGFKGQVNFKQLF
jgi:ubiquinone/menaquinone biosynthesis C-methylase UbiE